MIHLLIYPVRWTLSRTESFSSSPLHSSWYVVDNEDNYSGNAPLHSDIHSCVHASKLRKKRINKLRIWAKKLLYKAKIYPQLTVNVYSMDLQTIRLDGVGKSRVLVLCRPQQLT